jgi:protein ImuB
VREPLSPRRPPAAYEARRAFAEPIADAASIGAALDDLLGELCTGLAHAGRGARRVALTLFCIDGEARGLRIGTSRPVRDGCALARLFAEKLDGLDPGAGIEVMALAAPATDPLPARQLDLDPGLTPGFNPGAGGAGDDGAALADLVDRIANRLGPRRVVRLGPRQSHLPDRAVVRLVPLPNDTRAAWPAAPPRPIRLLSPAVPVEAVAAVPDGPPLLFRWRGRVHRVARASGPERIAEEWWHEDECVRDYYRVEDETGARFWLYREGLYEGMPGGDAPRWYLHGLFA